MDTMTSQQRMLCAAADLAREYAVHWVGAEHIARYILRRRRGECTEPPYVGGARVTVTHFPGNSCCKTHLLPGWSRGRRLSGGAVRAPPLGRVTNSHRSRGISHGQNHCRPGYRNCRTSWVQLEQWRHSEHYRPHHTAHDDDHYPEACPRTFGMVRQRRLLGRRETVRWREGVDPPCSLHRRAARRRHIRVLGALLRASLLPH